MECNKDNALRAKEMAEKRFLQKDLGGARLLAMKAQALYPNIGGLPQFLATLDVYIAAEKRIRGEIDWYKILGAQPLADDEAIRKCYRKMALALHPDKNKSVGADGAFNLISQAWTVLSDKAKRTEFDRKYMWWDSLKEISDEKPTPAPPLKLQTFWTLCTSCRTKFEYLAMYRNCNLACTSCNKSFFASEIPTPSVYANASSTSRPSHMKQHNFNSTGLGRNCHVSSRTPMSAVNLPFGSRPFSMPGGISNVLSSVSSASGAPGVFRMPSESLKRKRGDSTPFMWEEVRSGKTHAPETTVAGSVFQSSCFMSNPVLKSDGARKKRCTGEHKADGDRRDMENEMESKKGINLTNEFGSRKNSFDAGKVSAAGNSRRNGIRDISQQQMKNILAEKARTEIRKKLDEWKENQRKLDEWKEIRRKLDERCASSVSKNTDAEVRAKDKEKTISGVKPAAKKIVDSKTNDKCTSADSEVPGSLLMSVPDPDFHDFDGDRIEDTFDENQVWAAYDDEDGMPRYYAFIHSVISKNPFQMKISWLSSKTNDELAPIKWVSSGFPKTTGDLRLGKRAIYSSLNSFSHRVNWTKGSRGLVHIYPKKGDVWALYRNWSLDWNEFTKDDIIHQYDMVEVLEDYSEEHGVNVAPLLKVAGFKTVFRQNADPRKVRNIPRAEMFRFSHQVPSYLLTGQEGNNAPKGFLELDPASTPMELLRLITDAEMQEMDMEMTVRNSSKDGLRNKKHSSKEEDSVEDVPRKEVAEAQAGKVWPENLLVYRRKRFRGKSER
ncbi:uncharacterized protein [Cicer arietinum]|uniref:Uncharacterized protein LOC101503530 n=1 Tax=Cicer arietinum TaxID=3827 RepID=A0A1S2YBK3_CICAR|nr:uncharacterized protein LOC101503530 [Cicer arietinum]